MWMESIGLRFYFTLEIGENISYPSRGKRTSLKADRPLSMNGREFYQDFYQDRLPRNTFSFIIVLLNGNQAQKPRLFLVHDCTRFVIKTSLS